MGLVFDIGRLAIRYFYGSDSLSEVPALLHGLIRIPPIDSRDYNQ